MNERSNKRMIIRRRLSQGSRAGRQVFCFLVRSRQRESKISHQDLGGVSPSITHVINYRSLIFHHFEADQEEV